MKALIFFLIVVAEVSHAAEMTGPRKILDIGCRNNNSGVCFITIEGASVGPSNCKSTSIRWDASNVSGGKNELTLLLAAYFSSKSVNLFIPDTCFNLEPAYPTFDFSII